MSTLAKRVATAVVVAPVVVAVVLAGGEAAFTAVLSVFVLAAAWEWAGLCGWRGRPARAGYTVAIALALAALYAGRDRAPLALVLLAAGAAWWTVALAWVVRYQQGLADDLPARRVPRGVVGVLVLVPAWTAMVYLHRWGPDGPRAALLLLLLVWAADIGAYFAGRAVGRRRLASRVSPGKTVEGVAGGLLAALAVAWLAAAADGRAGPELAAVLLACGGAMLLSVLGDLAESMFKRGAGAKDSGGLMPGHGGVLDRIDSLTAAAPCFVLLALLLGLRP